MTMLRHLKSINAETPNPGFSNFIKVDQTLFFTLPAAKDVHELWKSDGSVKGTVRVANFNFEGNLELESVNNQLFFTANDTLSGEELWKSDGTASGTVRVADIQSGIASSSPNNLTVVDNTLFFTVNAGVSGIELWKSDGTANGTERVASVMPGSPSASILEMTASGNSLFFIAKPGIALGELWRSDGTANGTIKLSAFEIPSYPYSSELTSVGNQVFFLAIEDDHTYAYPHTIWKSDGTANGTHIVDNAFSPEEFTAVGNTLFFSAGELGPFYGGYNLELWKYDDTAKGVVQVAEINTKTMYDDYALTSGSYPRSLTALGNTIYFSADDGVNGRELWKSDGTASGTVLVADINPGKADSGPRNLTVVGQSLYFTADDGVSGSELWKSDGTASGTVRVADIRAGLASSNPRNLTIVGDTLFLTSDDGIGGKKLWSLDTTAPTLPNITIAATTNTVPEDAGLPLVYTFTRTGSTAKALLAKYIVAGTARLSGTTTNPADYRINNKLSASVVQTVTFLAGSSTAVVKVYPIADTRHEADETVSFRVISTTDYTIGVNTTAIGTIVNDEPAIIRLASSTNSVREDAGLPLIYTFTRIGPITSALTVNYTVGGSALLVAAKKDPADFRVDSSSSTEVARSVIFAPGASTATVKIQPIPDTRFESEETVSLRLSTGTDYTLETITPVTGTIKNDDVKSDASRVLRADLSSLRLTGSKRINGTGNSLDNSIFGNSSNNRLAGLRGKDLLTGGGGQNVFVFDDLSDSLLNDPRSGTSGRFDEIIDFNPDDRISAPFSVETDRLTTSLGTAASITPDALAAVLTPTAFAANSVAGFAVSTHNGTFIAMNDSRPGFQAETDALVLLRNYVISASNVVDFI